ncbi:YpiB family protein [Salinicoccus sp. ID82-1]|uniref:IDEAL domain-containing protein n=2 Tax=Staphylococcaceae TaxID=90964 RepID=A0A558B052_9STAP|nr:YpiB family protein [Salinicoccus sp. ID82-1]TVT29881.1 IDEAL domain-containing protein [Salinicoccus cyprini]
MMKYRKDFIDYVLYNYEFGDRTAVWILNFIKSHPVISSNTVFIDDGNVDRKLRISDNGSSSPTLLFEKGNTVTVDGEVIFHELNMNQEQPLLLIFNLHQEDRRYDKLKSLETDMDSSLEKIGHESVISQIDEALDSKDHARFIRLTDYLNRTNK